MRRALILLASLAAGVACGLVSALYFTGLIAGRVQLGDAVSVNGWNSNWSIGTDALDPYTRVWVARFGLLALRREEAVYFTTAKDSEGRKLKENCDYRISGGSMPGKWWSVTLYDETAFLPMNADGHLSVDATSVDDANAWAAIVSPDKPGVGETWISSQAGGGFDLTLRIYQPDNRLIEDPLATLKPPRVERLDCRG